MTTVLILIAAACLAVLLLAWNRAWNRSRNLQTELETARTRVRELAVLNDISSLVYKNLDERSMIETIVDKSKDLVRSEHSALLLLDGGKVTGFYTSLGDSTGCKPMATGILARVLRDGMPVRGDNASEIEGFQGFPANHPIQTRSILVVPILLDGTIMGELILVNRIGAAGFSHEDEDLLITLGFHAAFALERARHHQEVTRLANIDGLTGLNNHRAFQERLEQEIERARRFQKKLSLLMMDIDFFKQLNDNYGHRTGDEVLKKIACRIAESVRNVDLAARYGGEEFVAMLPETSRQGALVTAERIRRMIMDTPVKVDDREVTVTISIGVATFPEDASEREYLIDEADRAMYAAKKSGRNRVVTSR